MAENELRSMPERSKMLRLAAFWAAAATVGLLLLYARHLHASLDGDYQGWGSASCMVMARAFNELGAVRMHLVPFQNNLPVGMDPDVYLHWPPLYPLVLSFFLRVFGDAPSSGRILNLLISLGCGGLVLLIVRRFYSLQAALLSVFFFFTARATFQGGSALLQQPLAMLFALLAVYCFYRVVERASAAFSVVGCVAMSCCIASAWDPVFVPFGLLGGALWLRDRRGTRLGIAYCAVTVLTFLGIEADYVLSYPKLFANQLATITYRMGMHFNGASSIRLHTIVDRVHFEAQYGLVNAYWRTLKNVDRFFPSLVLIACCLFVAHWVRRGGLKRDEPQKGPTLAATWLIAGLFLPTVVWFAVMRNYVAIHDFPLVLAAPFLAIASGVLLEEFWTRAANDRSTFAVLAYVAPLILLYPLLVQWRDSTVPLQAPLFNDLSAEIASTPPGSVVLTAAESLVPTYYGKRHLVRGIESDAWLSLAVCEARQDFQHAPLFFALRDQDKTMFQDGLSTLRLVSTRGDADLYAVPDSGASDAPCAISVGSVSPKR